MRILQEEPRSGVIRLRTETLDDLWELSHIIDAGDRLRARTERKVQMGDDRSKQVRKPMTLTIQVTDCELEHDMLRVQGTILEGPEDLISYGDNHSIAIGENTEFSLGKVWDSVERKRLERAAKAKPLNILLVVFDRENAYLAELTRRGYDVVQHLTGNVAKKAPGGGDEDFWKTLAEAVRMLDERKNYSRIVCASPAFWNEYLVKAMPDALSGKIATASVSAVGEAAIAEVLRRPELEDVLQADRTSTEETMVQHVLEAIGKDKACYGMDECEEKAGLGQIELLLVSMELVDKARTEEWYDRLDQILETAKDTQAQVHLVEHVTEQLDAIGGIAGALRW